MMSRRPAKLTSTLIARKGHAVPSGYGLTPASDVAAAPGPGRHDRELGSKSKSQGTEAAKASIFAPIGHKQARNRAKSANGAAERACVSLRLDHERHLRLKLTAAHLRTTLQDVLTQALDNYLDQISPEVIRNNGLCLGSDGSRTER